jgi:hypothetical protein
MSVFIPFNFDPIATTRKTSSYTIPVGRYARAKPASRTGTINGVEYLSGTTATISPSAGNASGTGILVDSNTFNGRLEVTEVAVGTAIISLTLTTSAAPSYVLRQISWPTTSFSVFWENGHAISGDAFPSAPSKILTYSHFLISSDQINSGSNAYRQSIIYYENPEYTWVPSGTVLAGCNWMVEEFVKYV